MASYKTFIDRQTDGQTQDKADYIEPAFSWAGSIRFYITYSNFIPSSRYMTRLHDNIFLLL